MFLESLPPALQIQIHNYLHILAISLLYYDHILTFADEVEYIWKRPKARSAWLYLPNRYFLPLTTTALAALSFKEGPTDQINCKWILHIARQISLVINQGLVCLLLSLRVYALYNRSSRICAILFGSAVVLAGAILAHMFSYHKDLLSHTFQNYCHVGISDDRAIRLATAWEGLFVYDAILFGLTVAKTCRTRRLHGNVPILALVFRDGAVYFAVITLANATNIVTYWLCGPFLKGGLSSFSSSLSTVMTSRFMLNLHAASDLGIYSQFSPDENQRAAVRYYHSSTRGALREGVELDTIWTAELERDAESPTGGLDPKPRSRTHAPSGHIEC